MAVYTMFAPAGAPGGRPRPPKLPRGWMAPATYKGLSTYAAKTSGPYSPPAGSSSTPVSPSGAVMPVDPAYDQQVAALQRQRDTTISGLRGQRAASLLGFGYNEGAGGALSFDPSNAFSKAAQYKKRYDESRAATGINMASRGQLYAGSYQTSQDQINQQQLQSEDALQKQALSYLAGNTAQQAQARTDYQSGEADAGAGRLDRLATNPLYTPGTADAGTPAKAPPPAAAAAGAPVSRGIPQKYRGHLGPGAFLKPPAKPKPRGPQPTPKSRKPSRRVR